MIRRLFFGCLTLWALLTPLIPVVSADSLLPIPDKSNYDRVIGDNKFSRIESTSYRGFVEGIFSRDNLIVANIVIGAIALIYFVVLGMKMLFTGGSDENIGGYRKEFGWIALGLSVTSFSLFIGMEVLNPDVSQNLAEQNSNLKAFMKGLASVDTFMRVLAGSVALAMMLISGYNLMINSGQEEEVANERRFIRSFLTGIGIILFAEVIVRVASQYGFSEGSSVESARDGITEIIGLVNYILTFFAVIALVMIVLASTYYVTSFGDEDRTGRAKKIIIANITALVVVVSMLVVSRVLVQPTVF